MPLRQRAFQESQTFLADDIACATRSMCSARAQKKKKKKIRKKDKINCVSKSNCPVTCGRYVTPVSLTASVLLSEVSAIPVYRVREVVYWAAKTCFLD